MAENVTLARPYAEAVFALARESGTLDAWAQALTRLAVVGADPQVRELLSSPRVSSAQMVQLLQDTGALASGSEQANFVQVLVENDRAQFLPEISGLFDEFKNAHDGIKDALVVSAFPVDAASLARLTADIEAHFKSKVRVSVQIDPELIGGVRIAVGDEVIDASVRGKLATMAAALQN
jgi:F-type H+-transporting ATPase subunit delta